MKEINSYIEEISKADTQNLPIVYLLAIASENNADSTDLIRINNIVLLENKKLIYLKDLLNLFGNNFINIINDLLTKIDKEKYEIEIVYKEDNKDNKVLKISNLDNEELKKLKEKTRKFIIETIEKSKKDFKDYLFKLENWQENFNKDYFDLPFLYLLIIFRQCISDKDIYMYCINLGLDDNIINFIFADTKIYNIYIDESGKIINNEEFLVGGYFIEDINFRCWNEKARRLFYNILGKYSNNISNKKIIYHRNEIKNKKLKKNITYDVFNFVKINNGKFISICENKVKNNLFSRRYYISLLSELIMYTVRTIIVENKINLIDDKLLLIIKVSSRSYKDQYNSITFKFKDVEKFLTNAIDSKIEVSEILDKWKSDADQYLTRERYIEKLDISPVIYDGIEQVKIKYGLNTKNIDYEILDFEMASMTPDLVIADYFCNFYFNFIKVEELKNLIDIFGYMIYTNIEYNPFNSEIDFDFNMKDYYNILKRVILYKKISSSDKVTKYTREYSKKLVAKIIEYLKTDNHTNKNRYIVGALKSILENIEYQSDFIRNYSDIIDSYNVLIDLAKNNVLTNDKVLNGAIIFAINTGKLYVFNHADDDEKAREVVEDNKNYRDDVLKSVDFIDIVVLFDNISSIVYWYKYNTKYSIKALKQTLSNKNIEIEDYEKARLHGTLGQSYNINYYITNNTNDLINAKDAFIKAINYFNNNNLEIIREYSYLQNVAITAKDENEFLEYTEKYLNLISDDYKNIVELNNKIDTYLSLSNKDKGYEFFVIRLLRYCNTFKITKKSKEIANLLITNHKHFIENNIVSLEDVDIQKEYGLLLYKYNDGEIDTQYLKKCYSFMKGQLGTFNYMRMLSLYLIEILMDNESNIDKALSIIIDLSKITGAGYKIAFKGLHNKASIVNIKEWASNVRDKLYM
ncbi:hypothetical protein Bint_1111 [Brachyspira intermedia PWS/A]|uniref:Uncharacterized protein n=1 Tax=Brachyspira intermedia (strain ATCC 51140 / PWS/A) TaxID=1045858 RepID=G0EMP6_BRAIP|nr:hypothetical protein [Brachyspira intermedia]AEM21734.1 hypothetical protein Bint_1111 [Brachyspira intermedia PWS/A]